MNWRLRNQILIVLGLLLLSAATVAVADAVCVMVWVGGFDLTVEVNCTNEPPKSVVCQAYWKHKDAELAAVQHSPLESEVRSLHVDPFTGQPLTVHIQSGGRTSWLLRRELSYHQCRAIAVVATMADGRRVGKVVDIPDCRTAPRPITVQVVLP